MRVCVCVCERVMLWAALLGLALFLCSGGDWWEHKFWYLGNWVLIMVMEWSGNRTCEEWTKSLSLPIGMWFDFGGKCVYCVAWSLRVALLLRCGIQKLPNFSKTINSNLFPNHKLIYVSPSLILYLVILFFFLRNVFSNTCYTNCSNYNFNCFFF